MVRNQEEHDGVVVSLAARLGFAVSTDIESISSTMNRQSGPPDQVLDEESQVELLPSMVSNGLLTNQQAELLKSLAVELVNKHGSIENSLAFLAEFPLESDSTAVAKGTDPNLTSVPTADYANRESSADSTNELETTDLASDRSKHSVSRPAEDLNSAEPFSSSKQRYQIKKFLAQGGIGKVSVAVDREFDREVAFKEIRNDQNSSRDQVDRFWVEAQVTGNLEHPGIVPVYSLGKRENSEPFYAMRFIRGQSMSEAVKRFHSTKPASDDSSQQIEFRKLLQNFVSVCNTIHFAHSRQVIHRDIKPDNIMLGAFGETLVVDWGLAKQLAEDASSSTESETEISSSEQSADLSKLDDRSLPDLIKRAATQQGAIMGTLGYMSPEQLMGWQDKIDPRSDVYSLGGLLYAILAGTNPNANEDFAKITENTLAGTTKPIRQINPTAPKALAAIAEKAMSPKPADRYQTAADLATDVEAFLADEPVTAFRDPATVRIRRWLRRHPALTSATLASIALTILGLTIGLGVVGRLNGKLETANFDLTTAIRREVTERERAEENFKIAESAVETYLASTSSDPNLSTPQFSSIRKTLLQSAIPFYQEFLAQRPEDMKYDFSQGKAHFRLGQIYLETGDYQPGIEQFEFGLKTFDALMADEPSNGDWVLWRSRCQNELVTCYFRQHKHAQAIQTAKSSIDTLTKLHQETPDDPKTLRDLINVTSNVGASQFALEKFEDAEASSKRHSELVEQLIAIEGTVSPQNHFQLAVNLNNLGAMKNQQQQWNAGYEQLLKAIKIGNELVTKYPNVQRYRHNLALAYHNIGRSLRGLKSYQDAINNFKVADTQDTWLARTYPNVAAYQLSMAMNYKSMATTYSDWGRRPEALEHYQKAETAFQKLVTSHPQVPEYRFRLAMTHNDLGLYENNPNDVAKRTAYAKRAVDAFELLLKEKPDFSGYRYHLAAAQTNLALCFRDQKKTKEALKWYLASASNNEHLDDETLRGRQSRFNTYWGLGECYVDLEQHLKATEAWDQAAQYSDDPVMSHIFNVRSARSSALSKKFDVAEAMIKKLVDFPQRTAETYYRIAEIYAICAVSSEEEDSKTRFTDLTLEYLELCKSQGGFQQQGLVNKVKSNEWIQKAVDSADLKELLGK